MKHTALVTGGSRGIGKAIALRLGRAGYNVVVGYRVNKEMAEEVANEICRNGSWAIAYGCDVADSSAVDIMFDYMRDLFGIVDVVVNNAGVSHYCMCESEKDDDYSRVMDVNLKGAFHVCRRAARGMIDGGYGRIINISSMWGMVGAAMESTYSASKAGVIGLTKSLAKELAGAGVTVNAVAPGVIATDMLRDIDSNIISELIEETPVGRLGTADDVARVVEFLASEDTSFVTGEVINVSGGYVI